MSLYFAYGSNMSTSRLRQRAPSALPVGIAYVTGRRLTFDKPSGDSGKADAKPTGRPSDRVWGVLFDIRDLELNDLDGHEGVPTHYRRVSVDAHRADGTRASAMLYEACLHREGILPFSWYLEHLLIGAREHGLPEEYIESLSHRPTKSDPDRGRAARERALQEG